ncbi:citrate lyase beta subunit [Microbacterium testaceum StLB037]|uniref:Citrate lyase beta subunit n=1 Tax=Microbacterium testaceum (strain StLB037) TaxID=979556 RepID=E8NAE4_MICTS|nr:citrate lyase beta subunit [Microbacterium testaceum StLB037]
MILDLEDAVAPADKARAREALAASTLDPERVIVRLNAAGTPEHTLDLAAVRSSGYTTVMLAKAESAADVAATPGLRVLALCETARGVMNAPEIAAHPATAGLMWGAEDLIASMNGRSSRFADGRYRVVARTARATVLLAARAHGKDAIDAVHLDIADLDGLRTECEDAAASGFTATACIHPTQVATIRAAYASSDAEREWARAVLAEAQEQPGVFRFRGRMIDEPVLRQAREILR